MTRVVRLIGAPASGKSTVGALLAEALRLPHLSIDAERLRLMGPDDRWPAEDELAWRALRSKLLEQPAVVCETSGLSQNEPWLYAGCHLFTVHVWADAEVRRQRLIQRVLRGDPMARTRSYVRNLMRLEPPEEPYHAAIDTSWGGTPLDWLVDAARDWLAEPVEVAHG